MLKKLVILLLLVGGLANFSIPSIFRNFANVNNFFGVMTAVAEEKAKNLPQEKTQTGGMHLEKQTGEYEKSILSVGPFPKPPTSTTPTPKEPKPTTQTYKPGQPPQGSEPK